eukprot:4382746-Prymnesium_polylepis.1
MGTASADAAACAAADRRLYRRVMQQRVLPTSERPGSTARAQRLSIATRPWWLVPCSCPVASGVL